MRAGAKLFENGSVKYNGRSIAVGGRFGTGAPKGLQGMESFNRLVRSWGTDKSSAIKSYAGWDILDGGLVGEDGKLKSLRRYEVARAPASILALSCAVFDYPPPSSAFL